MKVYRAINMRRVEFQSPQLALRLAAVSNSAQSALMPVTRPEQSMRLSLSVVELYPPDE